MAAEEAGGKTVSLVVGVGLRVTCLKLCRIVVPFVVGIGYGIGEDEILGLLGLLHAFLNLESDFDDEVVDAEDDDDDNSC